ncbi:membrane protein insertase YidC [Piscirickettsia litoralis]|uniref:Membrane protein insertase YidC n=1 Tax=Piscirickettsia litoralis TaxID=1891921 RepID=A0ABX3A6H3_9GAMM|nr:membrane protein insertase YidC [Piscirickettsia litoralis]ODN43045.1 membrane protein insertase YidC [Piscirickettsia litoralis]
MNAQRIRWTLLGILAFILVLLWSQWELKYGPKPVQTQPQQVKTKQDQPATQASQAAVTPHIAKTAAATGKLIQIDTDLLHLTLDTAGGSIVKAGLENYDKSLNSKDKVTLFNDNANNYYVAQSGVETLTGQKSHQSIIYQTKADKYTLAAGEKTLKVTLVGHLANGVEVEKIYQFNRGSYQVQVMTRLANQSAALWSGQLYSQLVRKEQVKSKSLLDSYTTYTGAAVSSQHSNYEKVPFSEMRKQNLNQPTEGGWVAMLQHYFLSAWVPPAKGQSTLYSAVGADNRYIIGFKGPLVTLKPGQVTEQNSKLYVGPIVAKRLEAVAPNLQRTLDYGWFWFFSGALFWVMDHFFMLFGNWGLAIIFTTVVVKLIFFPLTAKSYRSMAKMRKLQPEIKKIQERYKDDRQKAGQAVMGLYREKKVNPLGGCLPMLIQIPVFIALYWMIMESVELRHAPFIFWIHDLSVKDPFYILPVLMGISMFVQQRLTPAPPDPTQAKIMMFLPVVFTFLFAHFPAGLVLYWIINNTLTIVQQWWMMRDVDKEDASNKSSGKKKKKKA